MATAFYSSSGTSGRTFLPLGPITTAASGFAAPAVAGSAVLGSRCGLRGRLGGGLLGRRRPRLRRPSWPAPPWRPSRWWSSSSCSRPPRARRPGRATEMPRPARCVISALRSRPSTAASSVARRTSSGITLPEGCACAMRAVMAGGRARPQGQSRARSRTRTPLGQRPSGARQGPLSSRAASSFCHAPGEAPNRAHPVRAPGIRSARPQPSPPPWRHSCSRAPSAARRGRPRRPPSGSRPARSHRPPAPSPRAGRRAAWRATP